MSVFPPVQRWLLSMPSLAPGSDALGGERFTFHVACLAVGDGVFTVEREGRLLAEAGCLPLVVDGECTHPLVIIEHTRDGRFVADGAELGSFVERAHYGFGMTIKVRQNLCVGHRATDGSSVFIDQHGRDAHDVTAGSRSVGRLNRVAGGAGDALVLKGTLVRHALRKAARE